MTPQFKLILIAGIFTAAIAFFVHQQSVSYQSGYDAARVELLEQYQNDLDRMMMAKNEQLKIESEKSETWRQKAIQLQSREPIVITETEVQTIVQENNDCKRILGISKLLNKLTDETFKD